MRLDKYLKVSRLIKRRTVANEAYDAGRVLVNGGVARASYNVKEGDLLEMGAERKWRSLRVICLKDETERLDWRRGEGGGAPTASLA